MSFEIKKSSVEIAGDTVKISSSSLVNSLVKKRDLMLEELAEMAGQASVRLSDISIDADGKVVIMNSEYTRALSAKIASLRPEEVLSNGNCNC